MWHLMLNIDNHTMSVFGCVDFNAVFGGNDRYCNTVACSGVKLHDNLCTTHVIFQTTLGPTSTRRLFWWQATPELTTHSQ